MKKFLLAALLALMPATAFAQVVTQLPVYLQNNLGQVSDLGNGPLELRVIQGSAQLFTSQGSGVGSGTTTSITLTAAPVVPPCVGCGISGGTLVSSSIVTAFSGTTITTNTSQTVAASTPLSWGAACPASVGGVFPIMNVQASVGGDLPLFTTARVCGASQYSAGALVLPFAIGAH